MQLLEEVWVQLGLEEQDLQLSKCALLPFSAGPAEPTSAVQLWLTQGDSGVPGPAECHKYGCEESQTMFIVRLDKLPSW